MGTSYYFEGDITIEPPLNFAEIQKARAAALKLVSNPWDKKHATQDNVLSNHMPLNFELDEFVKNTDEGPLHVTRAARMIPSNSSDGGYAFLMCNLVETLIKELPGHNWQGTVMAVDGDRRSAVKIVVKTGKDRSTVEEVNGAPVVKWDNGDKDTPVVEISG